jgi:hypothetical protein
MMLRHPQGNPDRLDVRQFDLGDPQRAHFLAGGMLRRLLQALDQVFCKRP